MGGTFKIMSGLSEQVITSSLQVRLCEREQHVYKTSCSNSRIQVKLSVRSPEEINRPFQPHYTYSWFLFVYSVWCNSAETRTWQWGGVYEGETACHNLQYSCYSGLIEERNWWLWMEKTSLYRPWFVRGKDSNHKQMLRYFSCFLIISCIDSWKIGDLVFFFYIWAASSVCHILMTNSRSFICANRNKLSGV